MAASLDDVISTTLEHWARKDLADNIFDSNALFNMLRKNAKAASGGLSIWEPLMYGKSTAVGSYTGYQTLNVAAQQGIGRAEFSWKQYYATIVIDGLSESRNSGEAAVIDLLEEKAKQAKMSLYDLFNIDLYGDGTGNGSLALDGLGIAVDSTGTYGGLSRTTYTWWAANETAVSGALTLARMRTMLNDCSQGGGTGKDKVPDLIICPQDLHESYEALLQPDMRFQSSKVGDGSFNNLLFRETPVVWDEAATADTMFFLNTRFLHFRHHEARNFKTTKFVQPANQDARIAQILWQGNLTGSQCRRHGKLTSVTS